MTLPVGLFQSWYYEAGVPEWETDDEYAWETRRKPPVGIQPDESRLYIVCVGLLRGYAPIRRVEQIEAGCWAFIRDGKSAKAITLAEDIKPFRSWRYRWWDRDDETGFDGWQYERIPEG